MSRKKRKPWDETWHAVIGGHTGGCDKWREGKWTFSAVDGEPGWCTDGQQPGYGIPGNVARLAAAAPDLVRALLAVELAPGRVPGVDEECPWCGSVEGQSHAADCLRQAALRKAGVIE